MPFSFKDHHRATTMNAMAKSRWRLLLLLVPTLLAVSGIMARSVGMIGNEASGSTMDMHRLATTTKEPPARKEDSTHRRQLNNAKPMKRRCFTVWFGRPMSGARLKAFQELQDALGQQNVEVELVTTKNWLNYQVKGHPYHPAARLDPGLSGIHRGDYLRGYLMHHYGGCYTDIKLPADTTVFPEMFDRMDQNSSLWMIGQPEPAKNGIACGSFYEPELAISCKNFHKHWQQLYSNSHYLLRAGTPLTERWSSLVEKRLDNLLPSLKAHPSPVPGRCCQGAQDFKGYPVAWATLHGEVFHPLQFLYNDHIQPGFPTFKPGARSSGSEYSRKH